MGKGVLTDASLDIPAGVTITNKNKSLTVSGPLGKITKKFPNVSCLMRANNGKFTISTWFKDRKRRAIVKTLTSLVDNVCWSNQGLPLCYEIWS